MNVWLVVMHARLSRAAIDRSRLGGRPRLVIRLGITKTGDCRDWAFFWLQCIHPQTFTVKTPPYGFLGRRPSAEIQHLHPAGIEFPGTLLSNFLKAITQGRQKWLHPQHLSFSLLVRRISCKLGCKVTHEANERQNSSTSALARGYGSS